MITQDRKAYERLLNGDPISPTLSALHERYTELAGKFGIGREAMVGLIVLAEVLDAGIDSIPATAAAAPVSKQPASKACPFQVGDTVAFSYYGDRTGTVVEIDPHNGVMVETLGVGDRAIRKAFATDKLKKVPAPSVTVPVEEGNGDG